MSRRSVGHPEVRALVDKLVILFLLDGSVNGVQRALNQTLASDRSEGWLYPNRLHALLSDDPGRAVNTQTLDTLQLAVGRLADRLDIEEARRRSAELQAKVLGAWHDSAARAPAGAQSPLALIAAELEIPPAVVRWVLHGARALGELIDLGARPRAAVPRGEPDWSFQNDAYEASLRALRKDPNRKVGLIIPTGGGKTRIAVRVLLRMLADSDRPDSVVLWVTHRRWLSLQARRELQRAINEGTADLPPDATKLLTDRVHMTMLSRLAERLEEFGDRVVLVVVDEAHHAAAPSYQPIFDRKPLRGLFLTATPNRTDELPIGIEEICYTITYRELFERGVLVEPVFERPLIVPGFDWSEPENLRDLADYVISRAEEEFTKTLVVTSRIDHVEAMHAAIGSALPADHILTADDVGFVHGGGSSAGVSPEIFLDEFTALPRGILVTTAQMLAEGFDNPAVNAVVVTYVTSSMLQLMQAAGRALRCAPGKKQAFIIQVKESDLAYHYEQRWLYQDISDLLHPQLIDRTYSDLARMNDQVERYLAERNVSEAVRLAVRGDLVQMKEGDTVQLLLTGLPYYGEASQFLTASEWNAVLVTSETRDLFLRVFNDYSGRGADVKQPQEFLRTYLDVNPRPGSRWSCFRDMLSAMEYARREIRGEEYAGDTFRGYVPNRGTTWLHYVTFRYDPRIPAGLDEFLADAVNRGEILVAYPSADHQWAACVKIELPLGGTLAFLLTPAQVSWLKQQREDVIEMLRDAPAAQGFSILAKWAFALAACPLPTVLVHRFDAFLRESTLASHLYEFGKQSADALSAPAEAGSDAVNAKRSAS